jgi:hypothetical protein
MKNDTENFSVLLCLGQNEFCNLRQFLFSFFGKLSRGFAPGNLGESIEIPQKKKKTFKIFW